MFNMMSGVALLIASVFAGLLWDALGPGAPFAAGSIVTVFALVGLMVMRRLFTDIWRPIDKDFGDMKSAL